MLTNDEREYLLASMKNLLTKYEYSHTDDALNEIIDEWYTRKENLIEAFKRHPNYVQGQFMIAFNKEFNRDVDPRVSDGFSNWIYHNCIQQMRGSIPKEIDTGTDWYGRLPSSLYYFLVSHLSEHAHHTIDEPLANRINHWIPSIRARAGQRMSKVINKICIYLGYDKADGYNREFAKYADSLSPISIERHTVLSLNPLDYLTMSFGNSWASCHTIDKENVREMPDSYSGAYSSGTMSYMLDPSSMVLYTVDKSYEGNEYWNQDKINRQMFHWGEDKLVQGRLYPQANDYNGEAYKPYRNIVQEIISTIFGFDNLWKLKKGTEHASEYIISHGTHYRDYHHYGGCTLSIVRGSENTNTFVVGARPICIDCGERHSIESSINCCHSGHYCASCGDEIDPDDDDYYEIDGDYYHRECLHYCYHCDEYITDDTTYIPSLGREVCDRCLSEYYTFCSDCDEYHYNDDVVYVPSVGRYVCTDCLSTEYARCGRCGEYHLREDLVTVSDHHFGEIHVCRNCSS